jgi:hypothetical protein
MRARHNPFAVDRVLAVRYRLIGTTWEDLLRRLAALGGRGALVGPEGSGKTTLLEDLAPRLAGQGFRVHFVSFKEGEPHGGGTPARLLPEDGERRGPGALPRRLDAGDFVLVDGADALSRLAWLGLRRRARRAGGLVVTAHRRGLLPTLHECSTDPELLAGIVRGLLGEEEARAAPCPSELFARHGGNLRTALRELYDVWAER